jgi:hypothetical protein
MIMIDVEEDSTKARICQTPEMTQQPWNSPIPDNATMPTRTRISSGKGTLQRLRLR